MDSSDEEVDFEQYRKEYESQEHWSLRRAFLCKFWDDFEDENELLCNAQLFINTELLKCIYATEIMERIREMSNQVPEIVAWREKNKKRLKRTFVTASSSSKAKFNKSAPETKQESTKIETTDRTQLPEDWSLAEKINWDHHVATFNISEHNPIIKLSETQKSENLKNLLRDVILFDNDDGDWNWTLNKTTACMRKSGKLDVTYDAETRTYLYVFNGQIIGEGKGESKKLAKKIADEDLLKTLKVYCYSIKSKMKFFSIEDVVQKNQNQTSSVPANTDQLQENNLGFKMLKSLGWKGGSLKSEGIIDPINLEIKIGRLGLGYNDNQDFDLKYFRNLLKNFKSNQVEYDLVFSPEFTKDERAQIHQIASQLNLKTKSYGKSNSRHLVISSKISPQVLRQKLIEGDKYLLEKYEITAPVFKKRERIMRH